MVVGAVNRKVMRNTSHYSEIILNKGKFDAKCSCGWKSTLETRQLARNVTYLHVVERSE